MLSSESSADLTTACASCDSRGVPPAESLRESSSVPAGDASSALRMAVCTSSTVGRAILVVV